MKKIINPLFFLVFLYTYSFSVSAVTTRFDSRNFSAIDRSIASSEKLQLRWKLDRQLSSSTYKTLKNFPTSSVFNAPVPVSSTATLSRSLAIPKASIGQIAKKIVLGGARFGGVGIALQVAAVAAGYVLQQYSEQELLNDPSIIEGDFKDISKYVSQQNYVEGETILTHACGLIENCLIVLETQPSDRFITQIDTSSDQYYIARNPSSVVDELVLEPVSDEELNLELLESMTDQEFDDFINDSNVRPQVASLPESQEVLNDSNDDFDRSTDVTTNGYPDASTEPYTFNSDDNNLDDLVVPDYDPYTLSDPSDSTNTEPSTTTTTNTTTSDTTTSTNTAPDGTTTNVTNVTNITNSTTVDESPEKQYFLGYELTQFGPPPDFYEQKYPDGLKKAWTDNSESFQQTPFLELLNSFSEGIPTTGTCPSWQISFNLGSLGNYGSHDLAPPCFIWDLIKAILFVSTAFLMRSIIFGG